MNNDAPYVSLEDALGLTGSPTNKAISPTDILQRNIDTRSGNLIVNDPYGKIIEIGLQTDGSYNVRFYNSRTGAQIAQFGQNTDNTYGLKFLSASGATLAQFGQQTDSTYALKFLSATGANIAQFGQQADSTYNLKFFDSNGIGLAQFGQFPSGGLALKVAKPGIEVSTATNDQLIFNSAQNVFKIVTTFSPSVTVNLTNGNPATGYGSTTTAHGLSYIPAFIAFISLDPAIITYAGTGLTRQGNPAFSIGRSGSFDVIFASSQVSIDATNILLEANLGAGLPTGTYACTSKVYILQETFA